jgi:tape measure domain-containing protein
MAGEIAAAYLAILPSMRSFGTQMVAQAGPQVRSAGQQLGAQSGVAMGAAMGSTAARSVLPAVQSVNTAITGAHRASESWLLGTAQMAIKNVALYGSMYGAIQAVSTGVSAMFDAMVGFNIQLENAQIGFTQILGSSQAASTEMAWIKDFAKTTPFNYGDVVQYDQQLQAMIGDSKEAHDALQAAGDAAAGLGRGVAGIAAINLALGQMATKGKIQSQELVLQLSQVGINGVKILADQLGTTTADIQAKMQKGVLDSATYLPILIKGIEQKYQGLMQQQSATLGGMWSNIQDTLQQGLAEAGEPLFNELTSEAKTALDAISGPQVQAGLNQFGQVIGTGAKDLFDLVKWLWNGRDALLAFAAVMASRGLWNSARVQGFTKNVRALGPTLATASTSARAAAEAQTFYNTSLSGSEAAAAKANAAQIERATAMAALTNAERDLALAQQTHQASGVKVISTDTRVEAATVARAAAVERLALAERGVVAADLEAALATRQLASADDAAATAALRNQKAQAAKAKVLGGIKGALGTVGQLGGLIAASDGLNRVGNAADDAGQAVAGVAETMLGAAAAGASFGIAGGAVGIAAGAAIGGVVGLTAALVNLQSAQDAANKDTSGTADALTHIGVSADTAKKFLSGLTNEQIKSLGGSQAIVDAIQHGGKAYDNLVKTLNAAVRAQQNAAESAADTDRAWANTRGSGIAAGNYDKAKTAADGLAQAQSVLKEAGAEAAYTQFNAVEAANAATGSYGAQAKAAYDAATAIGTIPIPLEQTGIAAEGASGMVGYLLNALTGLPVNTPINFSTNATDVLQKIYALQQALAAMGSISSTSSSSSADRIIAEQQQLNALEAQLKKALTTPKVTAHVAAPRVGGGAAAAAANAAKQAAEAAAQKLKQDRQAQLQFADAFGTLMQSALAGDFDQYRDRLQSEITELARDGYSKASSTLKSLSGTLTQAALDYAALTNKIKAATDAETSLTSKMQDQYQSTVDLITGLGKVTDAQSFDQLTYLLGQTTSAATQYQDVLTQLKNEGLSEDIWNQLANAGPQSINLAQSILAQGQAGVDQLNSLSGNLVDAADSMGDLVSQSMYQQGVDAMQAYIDGLDSQSTALENQLEQIANNILGKTAGAITPGNAGYSPISAAPQTTANTYQVSLNVNAADFGDLASIEQFIQMLQAAPTTQLVNAAGTVTS